MFLKHQQPISALHLPSVYRARSLLSILDSYVPILSLSPSLSNKCHLTLITEPCSRIIACWNPLARTREDIARDARATISPYNYFLLRFLCPRS